MNREEMLDRIKKDNESDEPFEKEVSLSSWKIGAVVAAALIFIFYYVEWIFLGFYNVSLLTAAAAMLAIKFTVKAVKLRDKGSIVCAAIFSTVFTVLFATYIIVIINGWF